MSDTPSKQEVNVEPEYSSESSSEQEPDPPIDNKQTDNIDKATTESLADNVENLSGLDDDKDDVNQAIPGHAPQQPIELEGDSEEEVENTTNGHDHPERVQNRHSFLNSPQWYAYIRRFLTERQLEELWNITARVDKWYWDDMTDPIPDLYSPPPERLFYTDSMGLF